MCTYLPVQAALAHNEERVRASEAAERAGLVAEYEARIAALAGELERMRAELLTRTAALTAEMDRCDGHEGNRHANTLSLSLSFSSSLSFSTQHSINGAEIIEVPMYSP